MNAAERARWHRSRSYAARQGCDAAAACDYADHITSLVRAGTVTLPSPHAPLYRAWVQVHGAP